MKSFKHLIGVDYETLDCWGLVVAFYKDVFNLELRDYYSVRPTNLEDTKNLIYLGMDDFDRVSLDSQLFFGDILVAKVLGVESHILLYIGEGKVLHSSRKAGSVIDRYDRWVKLVTGAFRPKNRS